MDGVELIMRIEDDFGVTFSDGDAEKIVTVGDIHRQVMRKLVEKGSAPNNDEVWERLRAIFVDELAVRLSEVTFDAKIVEDLGVD